MNSIAPSIPKPPSKPKSFGSNGSNNGNGARFPVVVALGILVLIIAVSAYAVFHYSSAIVELP